MIIYKKELQNITWENIAPPYKEYEYFNNWKQFQFQYKSITFNMINAWWLIEAAALSYAEEDYATECFKKAGFNDVRFFSGKSTQCYVVSNDQFIIIVFRGTESKLQKDPNNLKNIVADIKTDLKVQLVESGRIGKVHKGFKDALDEVWEEVLTYLNQMHQNIRTLWITGHSLGAALATLAADRYGNVQGLYTFGSPLVGDIEFKNNFHINTYRFVNNSDIITKIPLPGPYHHVGELKYIDSSLFVCENNTQGEEITYGIKEDLKRLFGFFSLIKYVLLKKVPDCIKDHVPILYAINIWNNIVAENMKKQTFVDAAPIVSNDVTTTPF